MVVVDTYHVWLVAVSYFVISVWSKCPILLGGALGEWFGQHHCTRFGSKSNMWTSQREQNHPISHTHTEIPTTHTLSLPLPHRVNRLFSSSESPDMPPKIFEGKVSPTSKMKLIPIRMKKSPDSMAVFCVFWAREAFLGLLLVTIGISVEKRGREDKGGAKIEGKPSFCNPRGRCRFHTTWGGERRIWSRRLKLFTSEWRRRDQTPPSSLFLPRCCLVVLHGENLIHWGEEGKKWKKFQNSKLFQTSQTHKQQRNTKQIQCRMLFHSLYFHLSLCMCCNKMSVNSENVGLKWWKDENSQGKKWEWPRT